VARRLEAADLALSRGDLAVAANLEEVSALASQRLGLLEDALPAILQGRGDSVNHSKDVNSFMETRRSPRDRLTGTSPCGGGSQGCLYLAKSSGTQLGLLGCSQFSTLRQ
jgi:hypothetical protein